MSILRKVNNWEYIKDDLMGVTSFSNDALNFQSDWNTGSDAEVEEQEVMAMSDDEFLKYAVDKIPMKY